jgi:hypothetical protein
MHESERSETEIAAERAPQQNAEAERRMRKLPE